MAEALPPVDYGDVIRRYRGPGYEAVVQLLKHDLLQAFMRFLEGPSDYPAMLELKMEGKIIYKLLGAFSLDNQDLVQLSQDEIALMEALQKQQKEALVREFQERVRTGNKPM